MIQRKGYVAYCSWGDNRRQTKKEGHSVDTEHPSVFSLFPNRINGYRTFRDISEAAIRCQQQNIRDGRRKYEFLP